MGAAADFVKGLPAPLKARFDGLAPGTDAFSALWRKIADEDPPGFEGLQRDYTKAHYYDPLAAALKTILDANTRSRAVQECWWSSAVQHGVGGAAGIIRGVIQGLLAAGTAKPADGKPFDKVLLEGVYAQRAAVSGGLETRFKSELADALLMLGA
jgi:hypothetical protein